MTTTKLMYAMAVVIPGGFMILAGLVLARAVWINQQRASAAAR